MHTGDIGTVLLQLAILLLAAKVGAGLAVRLGQPAVLGELLVGVAMGNAALAGLPWAEAVAQSPAIVFLGQLGVILLLFEIGLESTIAQMLKVGPASMLVVLFESGGTFVLGWVAGALLLPGSSPYVHAFLGATLTATSIGITVRVLKDQGVAGRTESRIVVAAAVLDDVVALVVLATAVGAITSAGQGGIMSFAATGAILGKATAFLVGSLVIGTIVSPRIFRLASSLRTKGMLLALSLAICFSLSWLAALASLAPLMGAFAAGLILKKVAYRDLADRGRHDLRALVGPISSFLVPIFFVLMGAHTDLRAFLQPRVLLLALALTAGVAIAASGVALVLRILLPRVNPLPVAIGMMPRGEVTLIFAGIGLSLNIAGVPVFNREIFSAVVAMVFLTAVMTPPLLAWSFKRRQRT
jgi:Kef-type K+ transport system membrane component KefB